MLSSKQRDYLSGLAHSIKPTVMVGKYGMGGGIAQALTAEFKSRELIKVRFVACKEEKGKLSEALVQQSGAELVRIIGNIAVLYRRSDTAKDRVLP